MDPYEAVVPLPARAASVSPVVVAREVDWIHGAVVVVVLLLVSWDTELQDECRSGSESM